MANTKTNNKHKRNDKETHTQKEVKQIQKTNRTRNRKEQNENV